MSTKSQTAFWKTQLNTATLFMAAMVCISGQTVVAQHGHDGFEQPLRPAASRHEQLCYLVELANHLESRDYASEQLELLSRYSPQDTNLSYLHALVLVSKTRYQDAVAPAKFAVHHNSRNPDVWKLAIWLTVNYEKDYDDGLATMERLGALLNAEQGLFLASSTEAVELSDFMGKVYGFLSGPAEVDELKVHNSEQKLASYLTPQQNSYFKNAKSAVLQNYSGRLYDISDQRLEAQDTEVVIRDMKLGNSSEERSYLRGQMEQVEQMRMEARHGSSNERNVIAATRGSGYVSNRNYNRYLGGFYQHAGYTGHSYERGLDNRHYADVNLRERQYNDYLSDREKNLRRRMNNLAKKDERLLRKANNGNSREVLSGSKTASVLHTYVPLPVSPKKEIDQLLASYH